MRISLLVLFVVGCGGDDGTSHEGIYRVATWTQNPTACDAEGPSVAAQQDAFFYVKNESIFGQHFVNVKDCEDVATCKMEATDRDTIHIGQFSFENGSDSDGWSTRSAFAFAIQGQCQGGVTEGVLMITSSGFRIEQRHFEAVPFAPSSGEDECPEDKVEAAIAGQPCDDFEVVTATFDSDY